jgi:hypothetical protein
MCSWASRVLADFVGGLGAGFTVREVHANMLDAAVLAAAIDAADTADANVLAVVGGSGSPEKFGVFADVGVLAERQPVRERVVMSVAIAAPAMGSALGTVFGRPRFCATDAAG